MKTIVLGCNQHWLLVEALRRYSRFGKNQGKTLTEAWTGLGSATKYSPVVPKYMECATTPNPRYMTWWRLNPLGAEIVSEWLRQGYTHEIVESDSDPGVQNILRLPSRTVRLYTECPLVKANPEQRLYVIRETNGYSCLGFDVCYKWANALAEEMDETMYVHPIGTEAAYMEYKRLVNLARKRHLENGWRSCSQLTPQLIGLEGWRVEVVNKWGQKERFIVGKSMGFIPCHLAIARRDSSGGAAVCGAPFKSIRKLYKVR